MRRAPQLLVALLLLGLYPACSPPTLAPSGAAFDRPEDVAFFCFDLEATPEPDVTALERCRPDTPEMIEDDKGNPADPRYALHALVTQTTTGEVAAVRLTGEDGEPGVIDTDVRIPGFTFATVGAVPSALAVPRNDPSRFFVLSRGSAEIHTIETAQMRKGLGVHAQTTALMVPARSLPSAMLLSRDEGSLLITLPETGQVGRISVTGSGSLGDPELLDLEVVVPAAVDLSALPADQLPVDYLYTCDPPSLFVPPLIAPREPVSLGTAPQPVSMIIDPETDELLVADRALPMIHVIDPVTLTEVRQIATSVPVNQLALTPRVPASDGGTDATERFLYAIDETDGSVLVIDYSDPARGSFGGVLSVEIAVPTDRLDIPFPARALAIVSPSYDAGAIRYCTDGGDGELASGVNLHGVFLAVGTVDGRIRFFDIFDQDTTCRGSLDCVPSGVNANAEDQVVTIGRHRPRLGSFRDESVTVDPAPTWDTDGVGVEVVSDEGETNAPELVPTMVAVTCSEPLDAIFPAGSSTPRVCAVRDPWAARSQTFRASFEAALPFTATTGANLQPGGVLLAQTDFCRVGVLGLEDAPTTGYLADYLGDVVAIVGDLPPSVLSDDDILSDCEALTQRTVGGDTTPVLLPIIIAESHPEDVHESYVGRLTLGDPLGLDGMFTLEHVERCYPELLQVEIRTRGSFIVESGLASFQHPIVEALDHRCVVDPVRAEELLMRGRAFFDDTFRSPDLTFALGARPPDIGGRHPRLEISIVNVPVPLTIDVSTVGRGSGASLLTRLVYNDVDERLYAVDQSVAGLLRIRLSRLTVQQTFR